jgi:hypothetical protein
MITDSSVGLATGYRLDGPGSILGKDTIFILSTSSRPGLGPAQSPNRWVAGALSPGVERKGRQSDHSPPFIDEVKNGGAITPLAHMPSWHSV